MRTLLPSSWTLGLLAVACSIEAPTPRRAPDATPPAAVADCPTVLASTPEPAPPPPAPPPAPPRDAGVGHTTTIDRIDVAWDASAAVTHAATGSSRFWPALDGSREPMLFPTPDTQHCSVAPSGRAWTVFCVGTSGGASSHRIDPEADDAIMSGFDSPPFRRVEQGQVLPDGNSVLVLYHDHTIEWIDLAGNVMARLAARGFRPVALRLSEDGRSAVAILSPRRTKQGRVTRRTFGLQRILIDGDPEHRSLERSGDIVTLESDAAGEIQMPDHPEAIAVSPDGSRAAIVTAFESEGEDPGWTVQSVDLVDGTRARYAVGGQEFPPTPPAIGFLSPTTVLVSQSSNQLRKLVDVQTGEQRLRSSASGNFGGEPIAEAWAAGKHFVADGSWLTIEEPLIADAPPLSLGYRAPSPVTLALSPSGTHLAIGYSQGPSSVWSLSTDEHVLLTADFIESTWRVRFLDDDRLLAIDGTGAIRVWDWKARRVLAESGTRSTLVALDVDVERHRFLIKGVYDGQVFEVRDDRIAGPYVVPRSAGLVGLLGGRDAAWAVDLGSRLHRYSFETLASDPVIDESEDPEISREESLLAVDQRGRRYGIDYDEGERALYVQDGDDRVLSERSSNYVYQLLPSSDGSRFLAAHGVSSGEVLTMFETSTMSEAWSVSIRGGRNDTTWSDDASLVGYTEGDGVVVRDASTGAAIYRRCTLAFEVLRSLPAARFSFQQEASTCEAVDPPTR